MRSIIRDVLTRFPIIPTLLTVAAVSVSVFLGYNADTHWYFASFSAVPLTLWLVASVKHKRRHTLIMRVRGLRAKGRDEPLKPAIYSGYFQGAARKGEVSVIDERTCADLNLHDVFTLLDRTVTIPGANMLYAMIRLPLFDTALLTRRRNIIDSLKEDPDLTEDLQRNFGDIIHPGYDEVTGLLLHGPAEPPPSGLLSILGTVTAVISVVLLFFLNVSWVFLLPLGAFMMNMVIYYRHYGTITRQIGALAYIGSLVRAADALAGNGRLNRLDTDLAAGLTECMPGIKAIRRQVNRITTFSPDARDILSMLIAHIKIFFLVDIHAYRRFLHLAEAHGRQVLQAYEIIGTLDAAISVMLFLSGRRDVTESELSEELYSIRAADMYHPLLADPVANSFSIDPPGCIVTGSNMAGKSTFLRTVALNTLLAQTLSFCFAKEYSAGVFPRLHQ